jgi:hypothetical protein
MHATIYSIRIIVEKKKNKKRKRGPQAYKCMFWVCHKQSKIQ